MIVEISVVPIGVGESLSEHIAEITKFLIEKGIKHELTAMGTIIEVENYVELGKILQKINDILLNMDVRRIYMVIKSDFRLKKVSMEDKVESVLNKL